MQDINSVSSLLKNDPTFLGFFVITLLSHGVKIEQFGNAWKLSFMSAIDNLDAGTQYKTQVDAIHALYGVVGQLYSTTAKQVAA